MCFMLFAGTDRPLARREWDKDAPLKLGVCSLRGDEELIRPHFSKPEVQNVGSDTCCGCGFPSIPRQNGEWPWWDGCLDADQIEDERKNREALVGLLRASGETSVELCGIWYDKCAGEPQAMDEISLDQMLDSSFRFKEQCFYRVRIES
jgi:hypothetical protein